MPSLRIFKSLLFLLSASCGTSNAAIEYGEFVTFSLDAGGSVAEWLVCRTQEQKGLGSNRSRDAVG